MQRNDSGSVFQPEEVKELIKALKEYTPTIPDEITKYLLQTSGCNIEDETSIRLVSLATQRYISEIISVARNYNKMRRESEKTNDPDTEKNQALLLKDLQNALHDLGINNQGKNMYL
ncbi:TATA Binding Protein Associated Factor 10 [Blastocystis sp. ATCC 50177/Nand II]|uniref:TATA Binding Protein Associated Factor 10 n=1 Tax=Blastocystis sp. subtype 1 (strain ATCC 50177 / NandII) TaxID=478820 RepID=A0A196SNY7_BLAHN|nr:TATA Binding Protein Associated Factor 10 [Blastocystis sp. ATCC 50177/Nand II]